jgi:hypothetical protein
VISGTIQAVQLGEAMAGHSVSFEERLIQKVRQQIHGRGVGFLLGAGSSFLSGAGYPLASRLWSEIGAGVAPEDRYAIEGIMVGRGVGLEEALDVLDRGDGAEFPLRHQIASLIADAFRPKTPPLEFHRAFVRGLSRRSESRINIFSLNYDPLIELAADEERVSLTDGFLGNGRAFFHPAAYSYKIGLPSRRRWAGMTESLRGLLNLYKLHGSMDWFMDLNSIPRRTGATNRLDPPEHPLMIPPQRRKAQDTVYPPFSTLWSEFRAHLVNDHSRVVQRLVCTGYGMRDAHVNAIIEAACARTDFTLLVLARVLGDDEFDCWRKCRQAIIVTEGRTAFYGEEGPGVPDVWSFEWLANEVNKNARSK